MKIILAALVMFCAASPALADDVPDFGFDNRPSAQVPELEPYFQCAPYARKVSGIQLFGEARSWWDQAQGRYATGSKPRAGAVMVFRPHRSMQLGHVATVSRLVDSRRVLLDHANWSPVDGRRGRVEKDVLAIDVSPGNDWSEVRVWYAPLGGVGNTEWPVDGFIYPGRPAADTSAPSSRGKRQNSIEFDRTFADFMQ